jgi:preprotein translocase subunit SecD
MKTILYSLIVILIIGIISTGYIKTTKTENYLLLQSIEKNISPVLLSESAKIISNRLNDYYSEEFAIEIISEKNQIRVLLSDSSDLNTAERLVLQKGNLSFCETYNFNDLKELMGGNFQIFFLLNNNIGHQYGSEIGCAPNKEVEEINDYLTTLSLDQNCKLVWSYFPDDSINCLYALRYDEEGTMLITGDEIESMSYGYDKVSDISFIEIRFKETASKLWSDLTERNINNVIAIVLDNAVISAPIVKSVINSGSCQITGNFTLDEARYLAAIGDNKELPILFEVVK